MLYMRIATKYCEPISEVVKLDSVRCSYKDYRGQYFIGDLSNVLENPKLTDRKIGNGTHIFELAQQKESFIGRQRSKSYLSILMETKTYIQI